MTQKETKAALLKKKAAAIRARAKKSAELAEQARITAEEIRVHQLEAAEEAAALEHALTEEPEDHYQAEPEDHYQRIFAGPEPVPAPKSAWQRFKDFWTS